MKKVILTSAVLLLFALSISIFQISCQQDVIADDGENIGLIQLNKIIYTKHSREPESYEIWIANYDGTSNTKVNIMLPSGVFLGLGDDVRLSPDGKKIFFAAGPPVNYNGFTFAETCDLYSCNVDGSNVTKIVDRGGTNNNLTINGAY